MTFSDLRLGRFTASVLDRVEGPRIRTRQRPVIFMGGGSSTAADDTPSNSSAVVNAIAETRRVYIATAGSWGNPQAVARVDDALAFALADGCVNAPPVIVGQSNGSVAAFSWATQHPVAAIVAILPPLDVKSVYENNTVVEGVPLRSSVEAAFSITYPTPLPAGVSPLQAAIANEFDGVPMQLWYASNDPLITETDEAYDTALAGFVANTDATTTHNVGALGHTGTAVQAVTASAVAAFVNGF